MRGKEPEPFAYLFFSKLPGGRLFVGGERKGMASLLSSCRPTEKRERRSAVYNISTPSPRREEEEKGKGRGGEPEDRSSFSRFFLITSLFVG